MSEDMLSFDYRFVFDEGKEREFRVKLSKKGLALVVEDKDPSPEWAKLGFHQCEVCPYEAEDNLYCPAALAMYRPIVVFKDYLSYSEAKVYVKAGQREYSSQTTIQRGLSSLFGLLMATSGCPMLEKLRPMARFHLPFSDDDETSYRAISMYLVAQYLRAGQGCETDWELKGLARIYEDVIKVNKGFVERLRQLPIKDASINAIIGLDCFAISINYALTENMLDDLRDAFTTHLKSE
jgi:hypothetical protein